MSPSIYKKGRKHSLDIYRTLPMKGGESLGTDRGLRAPDPDLRGICITGVNLISPSVAPR